MSKRSSLLIDTRLSAAIDYYLKAMPLSESSKRSYASLTKHLQKAKLLSCLIEDFTPAKFREFLNGLKVAESTRFYIFYVKLHGVIKAYVRDHNLAIQIDNLDELIKAPPYKEAAEGEETYLTMAEVISLSEVDLADRESLAYGRELFLLMVYTGCAVSDIENMDPNKHISADGKWFIYVRKKTGKKCTVPVLPFLLKLIERNRWPVRVQRRMIAYLCAPLTQLVGRKVTCHSGRKSFGCIMLHLGFSMESVSKMMGHSSVATTQRHYAKVTRDKIESEMKDIPARLIEMMNQ